MRHPAAARGGRGDGGGASLRRLSEAVGSQGPRSLEAAAWYGLQRPHCSESVCGIAVAWPKGRTHVSPAQLQSPRGREAEAEAEAEAEVAVFPSPRCCCCCTAYHPYDRAHMKPEVMRFCLRMISLAAWKTVWTLLVSVAQVTRQKISFDGFLLIDKKRFTMYVMAAS
jgi:hypothetical protein